MRLVCFALYHMSSNIKNGVQVRSEKENKLLFKEERTKREINKREFGKWDNRLTPEQS